MTDNLATPSQGTGSESDAIAGIAAALADDFTDIDPNPDDTQQEDTSGDDSQESQVAEDESSEAQSEESDEGDEASEADEDNDDEAETQEPVFTVKVDGKTMQVPQSELVNGYQRQADYSRKTAALSEERKSFESDRTNFQTERTAVEQERGYYKSVLPQLIETINKLTPQSRQQSSGHNSDWRTPLSLQQRAKLGAC